MVRQIVSGAGAAWALAIAWQYSYYSENNNPLRPKNTLTTRDQVRQLCVEPTFRPWNSGTEQFLIYSIFIVVYALTSHRLMTSLCRSIGYTIYAVSQKQLYSQIAIFLSINGLVASVIAASDTRWYMHGNKGPHNCYTA